MISEQRQINYGLLKSGPYEESYVRIFGSAQEDVLICVILGDRVELQFEDLTRIRASATGIVRVEADMVTRVAIGQASISTAEDSTLTEAYFS